MILGFAHATRNIITPWFGGNGIPNPPEKWPLMLRQAKFHRLTLVDKGHWFPMEITNYDTGVTEQRGRLRAAPDHIQVFARDEELESRFFKDIGFAAIGSGQLHLGGALCNWRVTIEIKPAPDAPIDPPLDIAGYAALAFYSSDVEADRDHLLKHGGRTPTEPFTVELDRKMKIVMLRSPEGTIIELIQVLHNVKQGEAT